jgi:hypothetical protein
MNDEADFGGRGDEPAYAPWLNDQWLARAKAAHEALQEQIRERQEHEAAREIARRNESTAYWHMVRHAWRP